jgi:hydrogenase expression/formation protein HypD
MSTLPRASRATMDRLVADCRDLAAKAARRLGGRVHLMEVCGTHSHAIARAGIRDLLGEDVRLVSGPGCPVCVTDAGQIDVCLQIASRPDTILATFGDMVRVPGSEGSLAEVRARGGRVKVVYSPMEVLPVAQQEPACEVVMVGVGFELAAGDVSLHGFICPGHVSVVIGSDAYRGLVDEHHVPCVVSGFEPVDILLAIRMLLQQIADGEAKVENAYRRAVTPEGNRHAVEAMYSVFEVDEASWRGIGVIPGSGLTLQEAWSGFDVMRRFGLVAPEVKDHPACQCGEVLRGARLPAECGAFGKACTPARPLGPCMVSSEGACAAEYRYRAA